MRSRQLCAGLVSMFVALSAPGIAAAATKHKHHKKKGPTLQQQITAAVAKAERSPDLWTTINMCMSGVSTSTGIADVMGVRGQMPALGIPATLSMQFGVEFYSQANNTFVPTGATSTISLGTVTTGTRQAGVNFPFVPPQAGVGPFTVRGTITFEWKIGSKVVGKVLRKAGHGYANVGFGNPPGTTLGLCTLM